MSNVESATADKLLNVEFAQQTDRQADKMLNLSIKPLHMKAIPGIAVFIFLMICQAVVSAQDEYKNPFVRGLNKEKAHASFNIDKGRIISLDGKWDYRYYSDAGDIPNGFYLNSFDPEGWDRADVPSYIIGDGGDGSDGGDEAAALYLKDIELEIPDPGEQIILRFDGVAAAFHVWINGFNIGYSEGFGIPAEFNITPFVVESNNNIAVKVYSSGSLSDEYLSDRDILMGIYGHVSLVRRAPIHVRDIVAEYWLDDTFSEALLRINLFLESFLQGQNVGRNIDISLFSPGGDIIFSENRKIDYPISYRQEIELEIDHNLTDPQLWAPDHPKLYSLIVKVSEDGSSHSETIQTQIGFRDIVDHDSIIIMNGDSIIPSIADQDYMGFDYSDDEETYVRFFTENDYNILKIYDRLPDRIMDICDRNGIMIWSLWPEEEILNDTVNVSEELRKSLMYQRGYRFGGEVNRVSVVR